MDKKEKYNCSIRKPVKKAATLYRRERAPLVQDFEEEGGGGAAREGARAAALAANAARKALLDAGTLAAYSSRYKGVLRACAALRASCRFFLAHTPTYPCPPTHTAPGRPVGDRRGRGLVLVWGVSGLGKGGSPEE